MNSPGKCVAVRVLSLILPVRVVTCPSKDGAVRERSLPVRVPVRSTLLSGSKQFEPLMWTAPLIELPDGLMLPPIVRGGGPETVDVMLNCQLPSMFGPADGGGEANPPAPLVVPWYPPPPHPQN